MRTDIFIDNAFAAAQSGKRFEVINPATEDVIASVAEGEAPDIDAAVKSSRACFESDAWRQLSGRKRGAILHKAA